MMIVIPLHDVWITANFKETQLAKGRPGQEAEVRVDTRAERVVLRPGMNVDATIFTR